MPEIDFLFAYLGLGLVTGLLSGLLGVGGGVVIVPGLIWLFHLNHFQNSTLMHLAAGTSFAVMMPTTIRSFFSHRRRAYQGGAIFKQLLPGLVVGVLFGAMTAHFLHSNWLRVIFSVLLLFMACQLFFPNWLVFNISPSHRLYVVCSTLIGFFSSMLGVGGSTFSTPLLLSFKVNMREAVMVSILVGMVVSVLSCLSFILTGWHAEGLPIHTIGYVYWPAALCVALMSVISAPLGVFFSYKVSQQHLRKFFSVLLLIISVHALLVIHY